MRTILASTLVLAAVAAAAPARAELPTGYYRQPALRGDVLVFVAEGDLWRVRAEGGAASRITSHPGEEAFPAISPDGATLAFAARYEGPSEVYTMPLGGGPTVRRTYGGERVEVVGWTPGGKLLYATRERSTLPGAQLAVLDVSRPGAAGIGAMIPLAEAADGSYDDSGKTLYFTRFPFQGSHTKRYRGGTAQNIWRWADGDSEATPLTADYPGTSKRPMYWQGRVYFASDRDGTMNLWSMNPDGGDLKQLTHHVGWDVIRPALDSGRIVYQLGADIHLYDVASGKDAVVPITLESDFDQTREHWIDKPMDYLSAWHVSPDGDRLVLTARGEVFVAPVEAGRLVHATRAEGVRYREAAFMPDGKDLVTLSDQSGEVELWTLPADGVGQARQLTHDGTVLRWEAVPSPDGKLIAHTNKNQELWLYDVGAGTDRKIDSSTVAQIERPVWAPDGKWLAYGVVGENLFARVKVWSAAAGSASWVTTDRFASYSPAWSPDGKWLYVLSDRHLRSSVPGVWGSYQPEPYLDKRTEIYQIALVPGERSPFDPPDELHAEAPEKDDGGDRGKKDAGKRKDAGVAVKIDFDGIQTRVRKVPVDPGNYGGLTVNDKALFFVSRPPGSDKPDLVAAPIADKKVEVKTVVPGVKGYELSADGKKLAIQKDDGFLVVDAKTGTADLDKAGVDLGHWALSVVPREEWRQMFDEAWRLERDYFYAANMNGVDWKAMHAKYRPLVDRVTSRGELSDILGQMIGELSALHMFVYGGDQRKGDDDVAPSTLGAVLARDEASGGYRVVHVYRADPDHPESLSPLARPGVGVKEGDVITMINGTPTLSAPSPGELLRRQAGRQVRLAVKPAGGGEARDVIVKPIPLSADAELRYDEWEYTRRLETEKLGKGQIGYLHLRAMGAEDFTSWAENYYPVFTRQGLIVDVRHNRGGNIDSWILSRLMRKVWHYWNQHSGWAPSWNMQYAFRGHVVVLCDAYTASDGEDFCKGFQTLGLGKVIGTRTWGGEVWLSSNNFLVDHGIATAAEYGVYGPNGEWLIEGHGVEPDITVDDLPHAAFEGRDAQLEAAVDYLEKRIAEDPVVNPPVPPFPDKSLKK